MSLTPRHPMEYLPLPESSTDPQPINLHLLKTITNDFSKEMEIGRGAYGVVYKAVLRGDEIAVKKLISSHGSVNDEAFDSECRNLKKVRHKNVVRMTGYCYEISKRDVEVEKDKFVWSEVIDRALCFEYMKGGSLSQHISAESCKHDWPTTYKIIHGICEGLHHLHHGGQMKIFHLDLKPDNVLLDEDLVPKIGDFGLSRLFASSYTHQINTTTGTRGFMPQEYIHNSKVSPKNDVFSLGVIIFHMMVGEKGYGDYWEARRRPNFSSKIQQESIEIVLEYWKAKMEATGSYRWDDTDVLGVTKCVEMAMLCVEDDRDKRPSIKEILDELKKLDSEIEEKLKEDPKPLIGQLEKENPVNDLEAQKQNKIHSHSGKDIALDPSLELCFPFEPNKDVSCCLQLINKAASSTAFNINIDPNKYQTQPNKGVLAPCSNYYIILTLRAQTKAPPHMPYHDMAVVQSTRVPEGFTSDKISEDFFKKASSLDEVTLPIVYVPLEKPLTE